MWILTNLQQHALNLVLTIDKVSKPQLEKSSQGSNQNSRKKLGKGMDSANGSSGYDKYNPPLRYEATFIHCMAMNTMKKLLSYY